MKTKCSVALQVLTSLGGQSDPVLEALLNLLTFNRELVTERLRSGLPVDILTSRIGDLERAKSLWAERAQGVALSPQALAWVTSCIARADVAFGKAGARRAAQLDRAIGYDDTKADPASIIKAAGGIVTPA